MPERCDHCRFYQAYPSSPEPGVIQFCAGAVCGGGECRRNPPVWHENELLGRFPVVAEAGWCGCFEPRAESMTTPRAMP
jgi:hypothetical protein